MKATLEFQLPDDATAHRLALCGADYYSTLREVDEYCRQQIKYANAPKGARERLEEVRRIIRESVPGLTLEDA